jgi:methylenetetrahydrofolate dehydrogenase (NADP+)/methenyltetrahydrofolate cyclohydrolase
MNKINGRATYTDLITKLKALPKSTRSLDAILVGQEPASVSFLKIKERTAQELGIQFNLHQFPPDIQTQQLKTEIKNLAKDDAVGGIIIQLPLPKQLDRSEILNVIPVEKDIDALNQSSDILPPAVGTLQEILQRQGYDLSDKKVAVVGLGNLVGQPIAKWLKDKTRELYLIDQNDDHQILESCSLIISGVGHAELIDPKILKPGAAVVDFGYSNENSKITGDLDTSNSQELKKLDFYTPTPGGTGPILVAKLFENFFQLNQ